MKLVKNYQPSPQLVRFDVISVSMCFIYMYSFITETIHSCYILERVDNQKLLIHFQGFETARDFEKRDCYN